MDRVTERFTYSSRAFTFVAAVLVVAATQLDAVQVINRLSMDENMRRAFVEERYSSWDSDLGRQVESGRSSFADLEKHALGLGEVKNLSSGRQEMLENLINEFV